MKTLALFLVAALLAPTVGCEESSFRRITGNPLDAAAPVKATPVFQKLQIDEQLQLTTPEGMVGFAYVYGEISYSVTEAQPASLSKVLPVKPVYTLNISGKGELMHPFGETRNTLAKPNIWRFSGDATSIVEEGGDLVATFQIDGAGYCAAHLHVGFLLAHGQLFKNTIYVDFHVEKPE